MPISADVCRTLYRQFVKRLETDWPYRYADRFEGSFAQNNRSIRFYEAVVEDIEQAVADVPGIDRTPSRDTIRRILREGRISERTHEQTFQALSYYLTGEDWDHFQQSASNTSAVPRATAEVSALVASAPPNSEPARSRHFRPFLLVLAAAFLALGGWICNTHLTPSGVAEETPAKSNPLDPAATIREANWHQMQAYRNIHTSLDTLSLKRFYGKVAARDLIGFLKAMQKKGAVLEQARSSYEILEMEIIERTDERVHIRTREHWLLRWDYPRQQDMEYNTINDHDYILRRKKDKWVIEQDAYEGSAHPLQVPITPMEGKVEKVIAK